MRISDWSSDVCSSDLVAELDVCLGAARAFVVDDAGQAMAWCFGQPHVARNNSLEHLVAEVRFDLCGNLLLQGYPRIKHDTQQIGRAHVCTPVTNAHLVYRLLLEKQNKIPLLI